MSRARTDRDAEAPPSKTARKRQAQALQALGAKLLELNADQRARLPLSRALADALADYARFPSHGAKKRQLQFIGRLMRAEDIPAIEHALAGIERRTAETRYEHHALERWRDRLIAEDAALDAYLEHNPATDKPRLRALVRAARGVPNTAPTLRAYRELYRFLREDGATHDV